jgi:hypothetical protein
MTQETFNIVKENLREICDKVMDDKRPEYTQRSEDVLFNFKLQARQIDLTQEKVLHVFLQKHMSAIAEYCSGNYRSEERIETRIVDALNYLTLLYAMHVEPVTTMDTPA